MLALFIQVNAYAQWSAVNKTDDFTDETISYLSYDIKGLTLQISVENNSEAWITVVQKDIANIDTDSIVKIRIDKQKLQEFPLSYWSSVYTISEPTKEDRMYFLSNKILSFHLSGYKKDFFCSLKKGNFLKLRYSLKNGSKKSLKIPLKGITAKIRTAFGNDIINHCK